MRDIARKVLKVLNRNTGCLDNIVSFNKQKLFLCHLLDVILTFNHLFMTVEQRNYNKQAFKVSKVTDVYTYQRFKL